MDNSTAINALIEAFLTRQLEKSNDMSPHYQVLWGEIARLIRSGGKRLRSQMTMLSYQMFGGEDINAIIPAAAAQELLHLGMLIHDDIIDRDCIRYNTDNITGRYIKMYNSLIRDESERLHYARSTALLAGDVMISAAYTLMSETHIDARKILTIQKLLGDAIFEVVGGELLDIESTFRAAGVVSPETIAVYKTASYTFTLPMLVGATLAGASKENQLYLREFSRYLGIAYQLRDDLLGVFGNEVETGKTAIGDIREGKYTYLIEQFDARASVTEKKLFERYFGNISITREQLEGVRDVLISSGVRDKTERAISEYEANARSSIDKMAISSDYIKSLNDLISAVVHRTS